MRHREHKCRPGKYHRWAPGALHGEDDHDEATEWRIFKLDPNNGEMTKDIVPIDPAGESCIDGLTYRQAWLLSEAHNRDVDLALTATEEETARLTAEVSRLHDKYDLQLLVRRNESMKEVVEAAMEMVQKKDKDGHDAVSFALWDRLEKALRGCT